MTVVTRRAAEADALATALMVLGPVDGWALATQQGLAAHFVVGRAGGAFETRDTPGFASLRAR